MANANLYALNLTVDLSSDSTGFFNPYSNNNMSRCWVSTPLPLGNPPVWSPCNGGSNDSDIWGPTLTFHRNPNTPSDQVQFGVFYTGLQSGVNVSAFVIYASFGRQGRTNAANATASPFSNGANARCLLGDDGAHSAPGNGTTIPPAYFIGPYTVNVNTTAVPSNGPLNFEFSLICSIALSNGQTYQFGYDPEMDLSIEA